MAIYLLRLEVSKLLFLRICHKFKANFFYQVLNNPIFFLVSLTLLQRLQHKVLQVFQIAQTIKRAIRMDRAFFSKLQFNLFLIFFIHFNKKN